MSLINPTPPLEGSEPQTTILDEDDTPLENKWVRIARQIYDDSTEYLDANIRYQWEKSLSLFNNRFIFYFINFITDINGRIPMRNNYYSFLFFQTNYSFYKISFSV